MAQVDISDEAMDDLQRLVYFLRDTFPETAASLTPRMMNAFRLLRDHPQVGRRAQNLPVKERDDCELRELMLSQGRSGYVALYEYAPQRNLVRILRVRHQREAGYASLRNRL